MARAIRNRLKSIGLPDEYVHPTQAFNPMELNGGGNIPGIGIEIDAGVLRRGQLDIPGWDNLSTTTRVDIVAAHEYEEILARMEGMNLSEAHLYALVNAANTSLNISQAARDFLRFLETTP
jgi:hypothetical protein